MPPTARLIFPLIDKRFSCQQRAFNSVARPFHPPPRSQSAVVRPKGAPQDLRHRLSRLPAGQPDDDRLGDCARGSGSQVSPPTPRASRRSWSIRPGSSLGSGERSRRSTSRSAPRTVRSSRTGLPSRGDRRWTQSTTGSPPHQYRRAFPRWQCMLHVGASAVTLD